MKEFDDLVSIIKRLRSPEGCPWDRVQTVRNMKQYLLEEVYELQDAIERNATSSIREELGDIFLILIVLCEMFRERDAFDITEVFDTIAKKLISRHPHVFSDEKLDTKEEVLTYWIKEKAKKKKRKSIKCRLPVSAPSLILAGLFFKEIAHLKPHASSAGNADMLISLLTDRIGKLRKSNSRKKALGDMVFYLAHLAFISGVDLEAFMRRKVFREAKAVTYQGGKK